MPIIENEDLWLRFLDSPIAELEPFGLDIKFIGCLEAEFGLYIKDLQHQRSDDLLRLRNLGQKSAIRVSNALAAYWKDLQRDAV